MIAEEQRREDDGWALNSQWIAPKGTSRSKAEQVFFETVNEAEECCRNDESCPREIRLTAIAFGFLRMTFREWQR